MTGLQVLGHEDGRAVIRHARGSRIGAINEAKDFDNAVRDERRALGLA